MKFAAMKRLSLAIAGLILVSFLAPVKAIERRNRLLRRARADDQQFGNEDATDDGDTTSDWGGLGMSDQASDDNADGGGDTTDGGDDQDESMQTVIESKPLPTKTLPKAFRRGRSIRTMIHTKTSQRHTHENEPMLAKVEVTTIQSQPRDQDTSGPDEAEGSLEMMVPMKETNRQRFGQRDTSSGDPITGIVQPSAMVALPATVRLDNSGVKNQTEANQTIATREKQQPASDTSARPHPGAVETVEFGLLCKAVYSMDFKKSTFTADLVLTLRWWDNRTAALLPTGENTWKVVGDGNAMPLWQPDIAIINRDINGIEVLSTAIVVTRSGQVTKVERMLAVVRNEYDLHAFPFDSQVLQVKVGSETYMSDVKLTSIQKSVTGVESGAFSGQGVHLERFDIRTRKETVGSPHGEIDMKVRRLAHSYVQALLLPELVLIVMAYTVFWFPLLTQFVMPRVATSISTYMALTIFMLRTSTMLPARNGDSWLDIFEELTQLLMFTMFCLNILVEVINHEMLKLSLANRIQFELRFAFPLLAFCVYGVIFACIGVDASWLNVLAWFVRFVVGSFLFGYAGWCVYRAKIVPRDIKDTELGQHPGPEK